MASPLCSPTLHKQPEARKATKMSNISTRLDNFEARMEALENLILERFEPTKATKTDKAVKANAKATRKATRKQPAKKDKSAPSFGELRQMLRDHKAAGAIPAGVTVRQAIDQGLMTEQGTLPGTTAKKAKKAKAQPTVAIVAEVEPKVDARPRRANGTIAPKAEWEVRRLLEAQGLDRKTVDKKTAKAMRALA